MVKYFEQLVMQHNKAILPQMLDPFLRPTAPIDHIWETRTATLECCLYTPAQPSTPSFHNTVTPGETQPPGPQLPSVTGS